MSTDLESLRGAEAIAEAEAAAHRAEDRPGARGVGVVWQGLRDAFRQRAFVACVVVLGLCAAGLNATIAYLDVKLRKEALPLRQPLTILDRDPAALRPYKVVAKQGLENEMVVALGTDQYIMWTLEDTSRLKNDPYRYPVLAVTYYTGQPDQVPHVPEVCMVGNGYQPAGNWDEVVDVPALGDAHRQVPVRLLRFAKTELGVRQQPIVMYTFHANGRFRQGRKSVRFALGNPLERFAYFSKVEVSFAQRSTLAGLLSTGAKDDTATDHQEALEASAAVLRKFLPLLVERCWPDWETRNAQVPADKAAKALRDEKP